MVFSIILTAAYAAVFLYLAHINKENEWLVFVFVISVIAVWDLMKFLLGKI